MADKALETVFLNGEFVPKDEAKVSAFDRGFIFGDGIYEVVPVINSKMVDKEGFWARFERSLNEIDISLPYEKDKFEAILNEMIAKNALKEGGIYMQVTRGVAFRNFYFMENLTPSVFIFCYESEILNNPAAKTGIKVVSVEDIRWKRRDIKSISLLAQCYAKNEAHKKGADEGFSSVRILPADADADASGDAALPGIRVVDTQVGELPKAGASGVYPYLAVAACLLSAAAGCGWMRRRGLVMAR